MATKPTIEMSVGDEKVKSILRQWTDGIQECVNFGTHVLEWCNESQILKEDCAIPVLLLFRHSLELLDSISLLISQGLSDPCKILLRCLFESIMSIEYILQQDSEQRAMAFLVWHLKDKRKWYLKTTPGSQEYDDLVQAFQKDKLVKAPKTPPQIKVTEAIQNLDRLLSKSKYFEAAKEYDRLKHDEKRTPNWYHLFSGPNNIKQLADSLGHSAFYEILYRSWSGPTHGTDVINQKILKGGEGFCSIIQIRFPAYGQTATSLAITFSRYIFRIMIDFYKPDYKSKIDEWYSKEIQDLQKWLTSGEIIKCHLKSQIKNNKS
jgi:hypothetical protein